jgi:hypothetical protein
VAVTLDGRRAMSASGDRTLRLFDLESGWAAVSSACKFSTAARSDLTVAGGQRPPRIVVKLGCYLFGIEWLVGSTAVHFGSDGVRTLAATRTARRSGD